MTDGLLAACSTLFDPTVVWRPPHRPFLHHGEPSRALQDDLRAVGHRLLAFPFCADGYLLHLGRGTLAEVHGRDDVANDFRDWAADHHVHHYAGRADGEQLARSFETHYRAAVADDSDAALVEALLA